jgi:nitrogen fixation protein NifU and related proteins
VSSMVSEMAKGKTIEEAQKITPELVAKELEGLPKQKFHCSNLGAQALNKAIDDYLIKQGKLKVDASKGCPFCESEEEENPICAPCKAAQKTEENK